jgi:hypothetical protein
LDYERVVLDNLPLVDAIVRSIGRPVSAWASFELFAQALR